MEQNIIGVEGKSKISVVAEFVVTKHCNINHKVRKLPEWSNIPVTIRCYSPKAAAEWRKWLGNKDNFFSVRPWGDGALYSETNEPCPQQYGEIRFKKSWDFTLGNDPMGTFYVA